MYSFKMFDVSAVAEGHKIGRFGELNCITRKNGLI